uniref:Reverse transcriptase domain-containing protein n=1 Tax=Oryzias latipes TaxID=8090 RepID=A0A3B3IBF2_ORYLA
MRGQLISFVSKMKKEESSQKTNLLNNIKDLDSKHSSYPNPILYTERVKLQTSLNLITTPAAMTQLVKTRQNFFESGDKAGKLLAHQARAAASNKLISNIKRDSGEITSDPREINEVFAKFYSELYTSNSPPSAREMFERAEFPQIDEEEAKSLGEPITIAEIQLAINSLNTGKSPGPDGFSVEYYKANSDLLAPVLEMYNEAFLKSSLPNTLSEATISLILKKDKDPLLCSSYRPISLLNVDFKILSKVLASRLQHVLPKIISLDKTGCMAGRHSYHNTRRLLNIIHSPCCLAPEVIVSLDAEKAFDRVEWTFLYETMSRFGLGNDFIEWVKLLYSSPMASFRTNNTLSPPFPLRRGTRQGCPLSPALFAIAIEPLAIWLRAEERFKGIVRSGITHKVSLYADDVLLYISDPLKSLPILLDILDKFGSFSGYKVNYQKSEQFPLNLPAREMSHSIAPFKQVETGFKYLGIFISSSTSEMKKCNFESLLESIGEDFDRWSVLPLSLLGRVNLIKMTVLPKFLYLFQHIPILINKAFFDKLEKRISHFLWSGKTPRVRKSVLQSPKNIGGLSLPNFRQYYWAANIQKLLYWMYDDDTSLPVWEKMEKGSGPYSLSSVLCSQFPLTLPLFGGNIIVKETVAIWRQFRKYFGLHGPSILSPLLNSCNFAPSTTDAVFKIWHSKGLKKVKDLYTNNIFSTFANLSARYNLPNSHFFRFLQARDFVKKKFPHYPNRPPETFLDTLLKVDPQQKHCISVLTGMIDTIVSRSISFMKTTWEGELRMTLSEEQWDTALKLIHSSSICARHALIQCKVFYRIHYTNAKLSRIYTSISDKCNRCGHSPANHTHMFWACSKLRRFWTHVFNTLSQAYGTRLLPNRVSAIFGFAVDMNLSGPCT